MSYTKRALVLIAGAVLTLSARPLKAQTAESLSFTLHAGAPGGIGLSGLYMVTRFASIGARWEGVGFLLPTIYGGLEVELAIHTDDLSLSAVGSAGMGRCRDIGGGADCVGPVDDEWHPALVVSGRALGKLSEHWSGGIELGRRISVGPAEGEDLDGTILQVLLRYHL